MLPRGRCFSASFPKEVAIGRSAIILDELHGDLVQSASLESALSNKIIRGLSNESNVQGGNDRWSLVSRYQKHIESCVQGHWRASVESDL